MTLKHYPAAMVLAAGSLLTTSSALAQATVDVDLGQLPPGSRSQLTGVIAGVVGGDIDTYQFGPGGDGPFGIANASEMVYQFELTETSFIEIDVNSPFTGVSDADFVLLNSLETSLFNGGAGIGLVNNATGTLGIQPNGGRFKGIFGAGVYFLVLDPFNGVPPAAGEAGGTYDVDLVIDNIGPGACDSGGGPVLDTDLGPLGEGSQRLFGTTAGQTNDICAYADFGGTGAFFGFVSDGAEMIYSFSTSEMLQFGISQNQGVLIGARHFHYLLDGLTFTPGFDIFGDGTLIGSVADSALGFVDEDSYDIFAQTLLGDEPFGIYGPGNYYLAIDGFDNPPQDGFDGPYDINLELRSDFRCDDGSGFDVDQDVGQVAGGDRIEFVNFNTALPQNNASNGVCGYLGLDGGFTFLPGINHGFNEWIVELELTEAATIGIENFQSGGVDHDHFILSSTTLIDDFPFFDGDLGSVATDGIAVIDEEGEFGIFAPGTYYIAIDGRDGNGVFDLDIVIETFGGSSFPPMIDPAIECDGAGQSLGQVAEAFEVFDISACIGAASDQDTLIAVFDRGTGELIAADDDGCGGGVGVPSVIEGLALTEGQYLVSISGSSPLIRQRNPDGLFPLDASDVLENGLIHDVATTDRAVTGLVAINGLAVPFDADAFERDVFCFDVGPFTGPPPAATELGEIGVGPDTAFFATIALCGSSFATDLGVFEEDAVLIAENDGSISCNDFRSLYSIDLDPERNGFLAPELVGKRFFFAVTEFDTAFASGFSVDPGMGTGGLIAGELNGTTFGGPLAPGGVAWFTFTVAEAGMTPCNAADLAMPFSQLDIADVVAFLQFFGAMDPIADLAPEFNRWDIADIVAFLQIFGTGCPS